MAALSEYSLCNRSNSPIFNPSAQTVCAEDEPRDEVSKTMSATNTLTQSTRNERTAATGIMGLLARVQEARARRAIYRQTVTELSALSARELDDLGIHRSMIGQIATEAAWGK